MWWAKLNLMPGQLWPVGPAFGSPALAWYGATAWSGGVSITSCSSLILLKVQNRTQPIQKC